MQAGAPGQLVLRDIHQPAAPAWWPPAPGWWIVVAAVLIVAALSFAWWWRRRHRRHAIAMVFDEAVAQARTPGERVAAMSELLRRAARSEDAAADRLDGSAWLLFLDGRSPAAPFSQGAGRILLEGGFRRSVAEDDVAALAPLARTRYLELMARGR